VSWAGPRRFRAAGIRFDDLPPIDIILLSHDHYDHLDVATMKRLAGRDHPTIYAALKNAPLLARHGIGNVVELDWWQQASGAGGLHITAVPAQHFSARTPFDQDRRLWCGFVIESDETCIYFAGDTGAGPHTAQIAEAFPRIDLAILPIGAYRPEWFMGEVHMSPAQAVEAHLTLRARTSVASHFGTFQLADDGEDEPVEVLQTALRERHVSPEEFWVMPHGEGRELAPSNQQREVAD
jgi:L-ascorbate metabolism protein UlaG (beta-lactamase superfamily)